MSDKVPKLILIATILGYGEYYLFSLHIRWLTLLSLPFAVGLLFLILLRLWKIDNAGKMKPLGRWRGNIFRGFWREPPEFESIEESDKSEDKEERPD